MSTDMNDLAAPQRPLSPPDDRTPIFSRLAARLGQSALGQSALGQSSNKKSEIPAELMDAQQGAAQDSAPIIVSSTAKTGKKSRRNADAPRERTVIAALDIGSSKICCLIAEVKAHGTIDIIGIGHQAARGVKGGTITDLRAAETAVAHAVEAAEQMARAPLQGQPISSVIVNVPGVHCLSHRAASETRIKGAEVNDHDIRHALEQCKQIAVPGRDQLIHVIATGYSIDRQRGIAEPRGMAGQVLGVQSCAVTALTTSLRNINHIATQNRLDIDAYCTGAYAAGLSALVDDERQLGCTVIDMGGGTTSIAVFIEGKMVFTAALPVGGNHVTSDIARDLTTSLADAERIKTLYGSALATSPDDHTMIDVPPVGEEEHAHPNYVPRSLLTGIIQPRIEETFEMVRAKLTDSGFYHLAGRRVVLTGGASQLAGLCEIAQLILDKQVRLGRPQHVRGMAEATGGPAFATAAGLLLYGARHSDEIPVKRDTSFAAHLPIRLPDMINRLQNIPTVGKVTHWLKENW